MTNLIFPHININAAQVSHSLESLKSQKFKNKNIKNKKTKNKEFFFFHSSKNKI